MRAHVIAVCIVACVFLVTRCASDGLTRAERGYMQTVEDALHEARDATLEYEMREAELRSTTNGIPPEASRERVRRALDHLTHAQQQMATIAPPAEFTDEHALLMRALTCFAAKADELQTSYRDATFMPDWPANQRPLSLCSGYLGQALRAFDPWVAMPAME